jgi:hypothetical protein
VRSWEWPFLVVKIRQSISSQPLNISLLIQPYSTPNIIRVHSRHSWQKTLNFHRSILNLKFPKPIQI